MLFSSRFLRLMTPYLSGPDVKAVQERLVDLGYYKGRVDGVFDPATANAVVAFQKSRGLKADGVVGPDTWSALGTDMAVSAAPGQGYRIFIDTERFRLSLFKDGVHQATWPVAVGKPSTPTPIGDWVITEKIMNPGGPFGARWMRISVPWGGYGIHGTDNPASIGTAASHGCIRMYNEDVIKLYDIVGIGTPVKITGRVFTGRLLQIGVPPGSDIVQVQQRLQTLGYYKEELDGQFGPTTRNAVIAFQRARGLVPDGIVGSRTYEELEKAYDQALGLRYP
ncbi:ErfK/YbiS/YcfS/YnhG family protein [Thermincola ferriacetica]|uniref:ErfK/YbiS/YcfS/YnhG family protein n=1 Tax=Thermincola ferriacetica TaxID=281456 RepID=A0A0L6W782_9FIRM|nr:peptidoglycan-binding protein [Thermincola ferriacetica]KNZ70949.1 ErfK/YbiS/YcfS/YnhG family protein [Thermincola ferriacetica]